jgi:hypothetical protein
VEIVIQQELEGSYLEERKKRKHGAATTRGRVLHFRKIKASPPRTVIPIP